MIYIGSSGFSYDDWKGKWYPQDLPKRRFLEYYAERFPIVEINMSFYRTPSEKVIDSWKRRTSEDFKFVFKMSRRITHNKKLVADQQSREILEHFFSRLSPLADRIEAILLQLPPYLKYDRERLWNFAPLLPKDFRYALEFRHDSYMTDDFRDLCRELDWIPCGLSSPDRSYLPLNQAGEDFYFRFHGKRAWYDDHYSDRELREYAEKFRKYQAKNGYIFFNNDIAAQGAYNAQTLEKYLYDSVLS